VQPKRIDELGDSFSGERSRNRLDLCGRSLQLNDEAAIAHGKLSRHFKTDEIRGQFTSIN